jgi:D-cysteine desulfhydrase
MEGDSLIPFFDSLVCASGSGGTHAGMTVGFLESETSVIGISTRHPQEKQTAHIHSLAQKTYQHLLDDPSAVLRKEEVVVHDEYVGPGYSLPTEGMEEAVTLFARLEGILLDPVYTGKAAAGMIDLVRQGAFADGSNVLFLHTGGAPTLYHYQPIATQVAGIAGAGTKTNAENIAAGAEEKKSHG